MIDESLTENPKTCLECGQPLGAGRSDRKFCNDVCRTAFNNRRREENMLREPAAAYLPKPTFQKVFDILVNNRNMLEMYDLYVEQPHLLRDLLGKGFNPKYFTSEYQLESGELFKFCFDYGYHVTDYGRVYILERPEEIFC
jgi:hypothetical protein